MVSIQNLSFGYKKNKLLYKNLSLSLDTGSIYGLLGKNGAGKSTLLKNLIGLLFPTNGNISVNGFVPKKRQPTFLETIYFIPEEVFVPSLTIKRYINLYAPFYPRFDEKLCNEYLKVLDVSTEDKLTTLSFGQQKKFIIAFGLACNTEVLLLDEPTNGLDIPSKAQFRKLISSVFTEERMIFISTHQIRDLDNLIDKIVIVDKGELLLSASISEVAEKLSFKTLKEMPEDENKILYSEDSLKGISVVMQNTDNENSKVNLEHLFNAVTENPMMAKEIFNHKK
ncbi:MAG TPA: ABC transporter ATP-binding protein [Puia sp.]|nr:ABC transporter ATP-binding protein [Puia sp.]